RRHTRFSRDWSSDVCSSDLTLYRALEERKLFLGKRHVVTLPPFTLVGATTHEFLLSKSCRDRFRINVRVSHYSDQEMIQLVRQRDRKSVVEGKGVDRVRCGR